MRDFSEAYYPAADDLVRYLEAFEARHALDVAYGAKALSVDRRAGGGFDVRIGARGAEVTIRAQIVLVAAGLAKQAPPDLPWAAAKHVDDRAGTKKSRWNRRKLFDRASSTRREPSIRPKIGQIDFDSTEREHAKGWSGRASSPRRSTTAISGATPAPTRGSTSASSAAATAPSRSRACSGITRRRPTSSPGPTRNSRTRATTRAPRGPASSPSIAARATPRTAAPQVRSRHLGFLDQFYLKSMDALLPPRYANGVLPSEKRHHDHELAPRPQRAPPGGCSFYGLKSAGRAAGPFFDVVVNCTGFKSDLGFLAGVLPEVPDKYPPTTPFYESRDAPGLYFLGALMHGRDARRSSGGFVHGFRYLIRSALTKLRCDRHGARWPRTELAVGDFGAAALRRASSASAPFQCFGVLCDLYAFSGDAVARFDDVPVAAAPEDVDAALAPDFYVRATFEYGRHWQGRKRVIQRRFNVSVPSARVSETAPTLRERSER